MSNFCIVVATFFFLLHCGSVRAEKTNIIYLLNGDRETVEIKSLIRGKLEFITERMGNRSLMDKSLKLIIKDGVNHNNGLKRT